MYSKFLLQFSHVDCGFTKIYQQRFLCFKIFVLPRHTSENFVTNLLNKRPPMPRKSIMLILNNIRSAFNVGSIFRTADAVGVEKIYLCGYTPTPLTSKEISLHQDFGGRSKIAKTALGAEKSVAWEYVPQAWRLIERLKKEDVHIIALEQSSKSIDYRKYEPKFPLALIVGNEVNGMSKKVLNSCDAIIELPMCGRKESLNVAVAFGIAAYKLMEKKRA